MNGKIGQERGVGVKPDWQLSRLSKMAELSAKAGVSMDYSMIGSAPAPVREVFAKIGAAQGATCEPKEGCETPLDPRVFQSVMAAMANGVAIPNPPDSGFTDKQWAAIVTAIKADQYCPSPRRVGWQPSSLTFVTTDANGNPTTIANATTVKITVTSSRAFCSAAMVAATQTSNDKQFSISSVIVEGEEQVDDGPWNSLLYTPEASCCTCAREWPVVEAGSDVVMTITNISGNAAMFFTQVFGKKLYC